MKKSILIFALIFASIISFSKTDSVVNELMFLQQNNTITFEASAFYNIYLIDPPTIKVTVKINPDANGRFFTIVKLGKIEGINVIVTKHDPNKIIGGLSTEKNGFKHCFLYEDIVYYLNLDF